jgi:hypothetical protein
MQTDKVPGIDTNNTHALVGQIHIMPPPSRMPHFPAKPLKLLWNLRYIKQARPMNNNIRLIHSLLTRHQITPFERPFLPIIFPPHPLDLCRELDLAIDVVGTSSRLQVIQNLGSRGILATPVVVGCKGETVEVREVVASAAWVGVKEPGASEV